MSGRKSYLFRAFLLKDLYMIIKNFKRQGQINPYCFDNISATCDR